MSIVVDEMGTPRRLSFCKNLVTRRRAARTQALLPHCRDVVCRRERARRTLAYLGARARPATRRVFAPRCPPWGASVSVALRRRHRRRIARPGPRPRGARGRVRVRDLGPVGPAAPPPGPAPPAAGVRRRARAPGGARRGRDARVHLARLSQRAGRRAASRRRARRFFRPFPRARRAKRD